MRFHDNKGMMDAWHEYWESRGCEAQERGRGWPKPLGAREVSALLYMQWVRAAGIGEGESPLDDWPVELAEMANGLGEGGVANVEYLKLLEGLERVEVRWVVIRLLSPWERLAIGKWARIEEFLKERGKLRKEKQRLAKKRKRIYAERVERGLKGYNGRRLASVEELEKLALEAEKQALKSGRWIDSMRAGKHWNQAEIRRKEIEMVKKKSEVIAVEEEIVLGGVVESKERTQERPQVDLEVIRVGPNPRIVVCRYRILAEELVVKLKVKENKKFIRGMRILMVEQEGEEWEYRGTLPRHKGRW
jgi:hypothetical protein